MNEQAVAKLRVMLLSHHRSRLDKIRRMDLQKMRLQEIQMLVARYKASCFTDVSFQNQFWVDLGAIHLIPQSLKDAYLEQLHANQEERFDIALTRAASQLQSQVSLSQASLFNLTSITEDVEKESLPRTSTHGVKKQP